MSFKIGTAVGPYKIIEKVGQGGMATVYKAYHEALDRHVAVKVLHAVFKDNEPFLRRFSREAKVVARLEHPHIVPIYDISEHDGYPFLIMRFIEGETLKDRLSAGILSRSEISRIASAIAQALDYAHGEGVLHRDIKPSNILLTPRGGVYITDFGLARLTQAGESTLSQEMIMGTPQYISPEQAKGTKELDGRTDIYSFGIMLYEMVTGQVPFQSDASYSIIHSQIFDSPPLPSSFNENIPPALESVLLKVLSKEPQNRHETAGGLVADFQNAVSDLPTDLSPRGITPLPDYTPAGITRVQEEVPALHDLSDSPSSEITAVLPTQKRERGERGNGRLVVIGIFLGMILCAAAFFIIIRIQNQRGTTVEAVEATTESGEPDQQQTANTNDLPQFELPERIRTIEELEKLHEQMPENSIITLELAAAFARDDNPEAAQELVRATFEDSRRPVGIITLAENLLEREQFEMAEIILEEGINKFSDQQIIQQMLMMTYIFNGKSANTIEEYIEHLSSNNPSPSTTQIGTAYIAVQRDDPDTALQTAEDAFDDGEADFGADILFLIGRLLLTFDDPVSADEAFHAALEYAPPDWLAVQIEAGIIEAEQ